MGHPEEVKGPFANARVGKYENETDNDVQPDASQPGQGLEEPEVDARPLVGSEAHLLGHAVEVVDGLRANVIEIDQVAGRVQDGEEQRGARNYFMELQMRVQRYVLM